MQLSVFFKFVLLHLIFFMNPIFANPKQIHFAYQNTNNYPFQTGKGETIDWEKPGILIEMFNILEKKLNIQIIYSRFPWKRSLFELKSGKVDGLFEASFKQKRLVYGQYPQKHGKTDESRRTNYNSYYVYTRKNSNVFWDGINIKNVPKGICAEREYSIVDDLQKKGHIVHEFNDTAKCMELLSNGRVDAVAALELAANSILRTNYKQFKNIIVLQPALKTKVYHLMLSHQFVKKYPKLSEKIWDTVKEIRESKEMKVIYSKY